MAEQDRLRKFARAHERATRLVTYHGLGDYAIKNPGPLVELAKSVVEEVYTGLELEFLPQVHITAEDVTAHGVRVSKLVRDEVFLYSGWVHRYTILLTEIPTFGERSALIPLGDGRSICPNLITIDYWMNETSAFDDVIHLTYLITLRPKENLDDTVDTKPARAC